MVRTVNEKTKTSTPRINLVPQVGTVPRPPLVSKTSASNNTVKKLTPAKAAYLLGLRTEMNTPNSPLSHSIDEEGKHFAHSM